MDDTTPGRELSPLEQRLRSARARATARPARMPDRVGPYRVQGELGEGGMGYVYRASHEALDRVVALKLIRAEHRFAGDAHERFLREARIASRLEHPNLCRVYEFGEHEGLPWFAMELVQGRSLAEAIAEARAAGRTSIAPPGEVARLFVQVLEALHSAHERGLVHRDIKPSNIVVRPNGEPVVLDFGVARDNSALDHTLTASGQMIGTPLYLPREQVDRSGRRDDRRWDVYSVAVTLYECLTLARPFDGESPAEIFDAILAARPQALRKRNPQVSRELALVVETAMDPDPERRYPDCARFAADLRRAIEGESVEARAPSLPLRAKRWVRANPVAASVLAMMGVATVATGTQWLRAETNLDRVHLLAAQVQLDELREDPALRLPALPATRERLERFLRERVETLLARKARFRRVRDQLRARALPYDDEARARDPHPRAALRRRLVAERAELEEASAHARASGEASWITLADKRMRSVEAQLEGLDADPGEARSHYFSVVEDKFLHDGLDRLIHDLERFEERELRVLRAQLDWAGRVAELTLEAAAGAWRACAARVRQDPRFAQLELAPQLGLLPLGPDPVSGLEEFAHARSGVTPERGADGRLAFGVDSALVLVLLPGGSFHVGSRGDETGARAPDADELPRHRVQLAPFFVAKHELTQAQWSALTCGETPSRYAAGQSYAGEAIGPRHPVESVSRDRCLEVLALHELALPTEAQWEYACRAGTETAWWPGDERGDLAGCENLGDQSAGEKNPNWGKERFRDGYFFHAPVGSFRANPFGLHDLHGNVREWCLDLYQDHGYARARARPGDGLRSIGALRTEVYVIRGGAFDYSAAACRSARRDGWPPHRATATLGLRVARRIEASRSSQK